MATNVQALKDLYVALGGEASDVADLTTSSEVLVALQAVAQAAATELPAVKKADAGKTLTVNSNGKWAALEPKSEIDDEEASETTTYSSSKITSLIPSPELPAVTASDNGKLLGVVSGAWAKKDPDIVIIPCEIDPNNSHAIVSASSAYKKSNEIFNLIVSGKEVVFVVTYTGGNFEVFRVETGIVTGKQAYAKCIGGTAAGEITLKMINVNGFLTTDFDSSILSATYASTT